MSTNIKANRKGINAELRRKVASAPKRDFLSIANAFTIDQRQSSVDKETLNNSAAKRFDGLWRQGHRGNACILR